MKKKIINKIKKFNKEREWDKDLDIQDIAKSIVIEASELLEHFQWDGSRKNSDREKKKNFEEIADETADVFIYLIRFCYELGFDIDEIIEKKIEKNGKKYPVKSKK